MLYTRAATDFFLSSMRFGFEFNADLVALVWRTLTTAVELECWGLGQALTPLRLQEENHKFKRSGGVSHGNRAEGFRPAFRDNASGRIYPSVCIHGRLAPIHTLDGLPNEVVQERDPNGRPLIVKPSLVSGFLRDGRFYTREQAARVLEEKDANQ